MRRSPSGGRIRVPTRSVVPTESRSAGASRRTRRRKKTANVNPGVQDPGDQVAADHEEDVDADEAAGQGVRPCVVDDHGHNGDRAQAVDVRSVGGRGHRLSLFGALIIPPFRARIFMPRPELSPIASPFTVRRP